MLPEDAWERRHELAFALEVNRAECEFLTGQLSAADERLAALSNRATTTIELAIVACLHIDVCMTLYQSSRAVAACLDYLRHTGIEWSPHPNDEEVRREYERIGSLLGARTIEELIDLPLMQDPLPLATLEVLSKVTPTAFHTDTNLAVLTICKAVSLSIEHGNCDASCYAYVIFGRIAGPSFGGYKAGFRFGQLGFGLVERRGLTRFEARTYHCFANFVLPWMKHVRACGDLMRRAFEVANRIGDLTYAAYTRNHLNSDLLFAGEQLLEVQGVAEHGLTFAEKARFSLVIDFITPQLALIRMLRGLTLKFGCFDDGRFDELQFEHRVSSNSVLAIAACWYWIRKLQARYIAGDYATAMDAASKAQRLLWTSIRYFEEAEYHYYAALAEAVYCDSAPAGERRQRLDAVAAHHKQLQVWVEYCPENFEDRAALVGAEIARIEGRELDAERLYEHAIRSARANAFVHNEALANELAGRFYLARGFDKIGNVYLRDARYCYLRWGANGKVRQLEEVHPYLRTEEPAPGWTSTFGARVESLDLATVIKVSQAVSGEMVLEKLLDTLMRTAIEQAGAERGLLILPRGVEQRIEAEATTAGDTVRVHLRDEGVAEAMLPASVLHYVLRTRESVILDDAAAQSAFAEDPYIRDRKARSILCLPLINQGKLNGVLYLENNLAPRVFAPARTAVLKLLAFQAAIALENTGLYRDLAEREAKIRQREKELRQVVETIPAMAVMTLPDGSVAFTSRRWTEYTGLSAEDTEGSRWQAAVHPDDLDRHMRTRRESLATGEPFESEARFRAADGEYRWFLVRAVPLRDEVGNVLRWYAILADIEDLKRAEAALREGEEQWKAVFENNPTMYFMVDPTGMILSVNPFGAEQLGYTMDELIGGPVEILFHEADRDSARRNAAICLEHLGQTMSWELRKIRKDGEMLWVRETARAMLIKNRRVVLVACEDITDAKRAEYFVSQVFHSSSPMGYQSSEEIIAISE